MRVDLCLVCVERLDWPIPVQIALFSGKRLQTIGELSSVRARAAEGEGEAMRTEAVARQVDVGRDGAAFVDPIDQHAALDGRCIDHDLDLLRQSYQLRYQVYCVERAFLRAANYPDRIESDEFDRFSIHVGLLNESRSLIATSRLVTVSMAGLPLFRHCRIYPHERELWGVGNQVAEISRLCMSRDSRGQQAGNSAIAVALYRATYQETKRRRLTHWVAAMEPSLHRLLSAMGVPFRSIGPMIDYFGPVAPYLLELAEFDRVIVSGEQSRLRTFLDGLEPEFCPHPTLAPVGVA